MNQMIFNASGIKKSSSENMTHFHSCQKVSLYPNMKQPIHSMNVVNRNFQRRKTGTARYWRPRIKSMIQNSPRSCRISKAAILSMMKILFRKSRTMYSKVSRMKKPTLLKLYHSVINFSPFRFNASIFGTLPSQG